MLGNLLRGLYADLDSDPHARIATGALRAATHGENFQERWMRENAWDSSCYNAEGLLDAINRNLDGAPDILNASSGASYPSARISHLFFGHDDVPVKAPWVHSNGNAVFPDQPSDAAWDSLGHLAGGMFFRLQSETAPDWARTILPTMAARRPSCGSTTSAMRSRT